MAKSREGGEVAAALAEAARVLPSLAAALPQFVEWARVKYPGLDLSLLLPAVSGEAREFLRRHHGSRAK